MLLCSHIWFSHVHTLSGACPLDPHLWAQAAGEQQLGCPMFRYLSETTEEERLHVKRGTIDLLQSNLKMRFVAPGLDSHKVRPEASSSACLWRILSVLKTASW